jgi:reactive intermediate/imine deaminase
MMHSSLKEIVDVGPPPAAPYSRAVKAGGLIYLSGTLAQDDAGAVVGTGDVAAQTRRTLERMGRVLSAAGSSLEDVVSVTVYLTSSSDFQAMTDAYRKFWPNDPPTRTTVITSLVLPDALIEITMIAVPTGAERAVIHPAGWMKSPNPYSYAIRTGDAVFLSGLVPRRGRDNSIVSGDIGVQTRAVFENAAELLDAAGSSLEGIVSSRVYLTSRPNFGAMNDVYRGFFAGAPPARATVVSGLAGPDVLVEMTFTASLAPRQAIGSPPPGIPISPAVRAGQRIYLSGALGNTPETKGNVAAQTRETLARLRATLDAAGASPADAVEAVVFLKDVSSFGAMNDQYRAFFGGNYPTRTTVGTPLVVDDGLVEIMLTAVAG